MGNTTVVSLPLHETINLVDETIIYGGVMIGKRKDYYRVNIEAAACIVIVYEQTYRHAESKLTLTLTIDTLLGETTRVHCVGSGGGEGIFEIDRNAVENAENAVLEALQRYKIR